MTAVIIINYKKNKVTSLLANDVGLCPVSWQQCLVACEDRKPLQVVHAFLHTGLKAGITAGVSLAKNSTQQKQPALLCTVKLLLWTESNLSFLSAQGGFITVSAFSVFSLWWWLRWWWWWWWWWLISTIYSLLINKEEFWLTSLIKESHTNTCSSHTQIIHCFLIKHTHEHRCLCQCYYYYHYHYHYHYYYHHYYWHRWVRVLLSEQPVLAYSRSKHLRTKHTTEADFEWFVSCWGSCPVVTDVAMHKIKVY